MKGIVKFFNEEKGFGFIVGEDGKDYFVHTSQVPPEIVLEKDDKVEFLMNQGEKGKQATNIKLIK